MADLKLPGLSLPGLRCPCGSGLAMAACCGPVHDDLATAARAEQVMRARYTAFTIGNADFLSRSWAPDTHPSSMDLDDSIRWERLEILDVVDGEPGDRQGIVEFRAHHRIDGEPGVLHERSRFVRHAGTWRYVNGIRPL